MAFWRSLPHAAGAEGAMRGKRESLRQKDRKKQTVYTAACCFLRMKSTVSGKNGALLFF